MRKNLILLPLFLLSLVFAASAQENGNLQIHFMYVGQGDGVLLVSPRGETVLSDNGVRNRCAEVTGAE